MTFRARNFWITGWNIVDSISVFFCSKIKFSSCKREKIFCVVTYEHIEWNIFKLLLIIVSNGKALSNHKKERNIPHNVWVSPPFQRTHIRNKVEIDKLIIWLLGHQFVYWNYHEVCFFFTSVLENVFFSMNSWNMFFETKTFCTFSQHTRTAHTPCTYFDIV